MKELKNQLDRVKEVCAQIPSLSQIEKKIEELETKLMTQKIIIPLVGEFSAGKSALLNALLGNEVLPIDITPTTFTINEVRFSCEKDGIEIYYDDEKKKEIDGLINLNEIDYSNARLVKIFTTNKAVSDKIVIVDTPGLSSSIARHEEILREYLLKSDAVFLTIDVNQGGLTKTTQNFLEVAQFLNKNVFVVFTKSDLKNPDELLELKEYANTKFPIKPEEVIFTSAKNNDVADFIALLNKVSTRCEDILSKSILQRLIMICKEGINLIDLQLRSAELDTSQIDEEINKIRKELDNMKREMEKIWGRVKTSVDDALSRAVNVFGNIMNGKVETLTDMAFSFRDNPEKIESAFDEAIKEAGKIALEGYRASLEDIFKQFTVDIETLAKMVDVGSLRTGKLAIDIVTLVITVHLLDLVLPGGPIWGILARLGIEIIKKWPRFKKIWEIIEEPIKQILGEIFKVVTRGFVRKQIITAVDKAVFEFREMLKDETQKLLNSVEREIIEDRFSESEKGLVESMESLKKEKAKKVEEFYNYINVLRNGKEVFNTVVIESEGLM